MVRKFVGSLSIVGEDEIVSDPRKTSPPNGSLFLGSQLVRLRGTSSRWLYLDELQKLPMKLVVSTDAEDGAASITCLKTGPHRLHPDGNRTVNGPYTPTGGRRISFWT